MTTWTSIASSSPRDKNSIFRNLSGWEFDTGVWESKDLRNNQFKLPKISEIPTAYTPERFFQSGVLGKGALEFEEINLVDEDAGTGWSPGVRRGQYFSLKTPDVLHSSESIVTLVRDLVDEYNRSYVDLELRPDLSVPISVHYLQRNPTTLAIEKSTAFSKVAKFQGVAVQGRELDTEVDPATIDTEVSQFKLIRNNSAILSEQIRLNENLESVGDELFHLTLQGAPVKWVTPIFSRPDIFRHERTYDDFIRRQNNPIANGDLNEGDYAIGYKGHWAEGNGVRLKTAEVGLDFGQITYKPQCDSTILFNKNVCLPFSETFTNLLNEEVFYLRGFPVLDLSSFDGESGFGELILDQDSFALTVDGDLWTRVQDLNDADPDDQVYQLDPLFGVIRFGNHGITTNGALPVGEIATTYHTVPYIEYDFNGASEIFTDDGENLDPLVNAIRQGFLVLDNRRLVPYKIELTANSPNFIQNENFCCYGPITVPASGQEDLITLRARVLARGNPSVGAPNIPVHFESLDGLLFFSQEDAVTDGEGYAYTEIGGISNIQEFIVRDLVYEGLAPGSENYLNPDPDSLSAMIPAWGNHFVSATTLTFGEKFDGDPEDVYLLIQSIRAEGADILDYDGAPLAANLDLEPYNGIRTTGGLTTVWSRTVDGAEEIVHPVSATPNAGNPLWTDFEFPINVPTGRLIVAYKIVIDRTARIVAKVEDPLLVSNQLTVCLELSPSVKGQWKLPELTAPNNIDYLENPINENNLDSSRISTGVFMSPNDIVVSYVEYNGGGDASSVDVGESLVIVGENFPTTPELHVKIFIVKIDEDKNIVAVKDITENCTFVSSVLIAIPNLPEPPTEEYGVNYWIAVGGFPVEENGVRRTAWELEINEP